MGRPRSGGLAAIVGALGGDLYDGGRRALAPGPGHGPADRSLSLLLSGGRLVVHSFAGDDWRAVLRALRAQGLIDAQARVVGAAGDRRLPGLTASARRRAAAQLWSEAQPWSGTAVERHARLRGVTRSLGDSLRFHPGVAASAYAGAGRVRPALLAAIRQPDGALCGVEVTYLDPGGQRAPVATPRKSLGQRPAGAAVRLDPAGPGLLVGEGVFSCLSAAQVLGWPTWALLSAANLPAFRPPPGVSRVLIAADRGAVGEAAAARLAARLRAGGIGVQVRLPPRGAEDWNEALRGAPEVEGRREAADRRRGSGSRAVPESQT